ncbi:MFS transporter [Nocardioides sp. HDW12B]|uniref:MFS transporter n=1 Tax=Nocardioides sp. HDW12B TaxID=2714939 RepID=UPI00140C11EA|nr:MFS transporter [Nocardioides sp. HDW12B]QIK68231.1 MFS transporter [Nocardioides sp. HDW12B]
MSEPGALDRAGLRQVVVVLSTVQIVSWGVLYYAFAALQAPIVADTGWSPMAVTGAFSLSQVVAGAVGLWVGRHLDEHGPRRVMTASSLVAVPGVLVLATAPSLALFYLGWLLVGVAMAGTLYPPAFAALTRWGGALRVRALTTLTLVAGLASTVFVPLATALDAWLGWRGAYGVLLVALALVTVPLHWWGLDQPWRGHRAAGPDPDTGSGTGHDTGHGAGPGPGGDAGREAGSTRATATGSAYDEAGTDVARTRPFLLLAAGNALAALVVFAGLVNMVPMLLEQGLSASAAALALGLGGVGQVVGRLGYARFAAATSVTTRGVVVVGAVALTTGVLAVVPASGPLLVGIGMVLGLARGIFTLVQATAVTDRWGTVDYGRLNGVLTAPALAAAAAAPFLGATLATVLGSYGDAFLVLAGIGLVAATLMVGATPRRHPGRADGLGR